MAKTTIKDNWAIKLEQGEKNERELFALLKPLFTDIEPYMDGKQKEADFYIPSKDTLIEAKFDLRGESSGNFGVEYEFRGKPSGIAITKANWFVMSDTQNHHVFKTFYLRDYIETNLIYLKDKVCGDDDYSRLILVPKHEIINEHFCRVVGRDGEGLENLLYFL